MEASIDKPSPPPAPGAAALRPGLSRRGLLAGGLAALPALAGLPALAQALPAVGSSLPLPPGLPLVGGGQYTAAQAQGKVLVVYWWATWCPFCAVQSPRIHALWQAHRARGLEVLAVSVDKTEAVVAEYLKAKGYGYPVTMQSGPAGQALPKPKGLPVTVVRDRGGKVVFAEAGEMFPEDIDGFSRFL